MTPASAIKMLFSLFTLSRKLKSKKSRKNLKILLRTRQESMTWRNEFSQECNQLRFFTASGVASMTNRPFSAMNIHVYYD
ncbi:hypothetical protein LNO09_19455 [Klebsiella variicola]|nr:hypothetical protein [Klebsiella variicola]UNA33304.1 hypothetical protein LOF14_19580 [Klebsiella variicola subsp. variicola]